MTLQKSSWRRLAIPWYCHCQRKVVSFSIWIPCIPEGGTIKNFSLNLLVQLDLTWVCLQNSFMRIVFLLQLAPSDFYGTCMSPRESRWLNISNHFSPYMKEISKWNNEDYLTLSLQVFVAGEELLNTLFKSCISILGHSAVFLVWEVDLKIGIILKSDPIWN